MKGNNFITIAVLENRPELITSQPGFDVNFDLLIDRNGPQGCGLSFASIDVGCYGLDCESDNCPFWIKRYSVQSMREWLKLDQRPLPNDLKENLDNLKIEADKLLTEVINKRKLSQPKTYTEKEFKNAYRQGAKDYCSSFKGLQSFLKEDVNIWFNNNKKK